MDWTSAHARAVSARRGSPSSRRSRASSTAAVPLLDGELFHFGADGAPRWHSPSATITPPSARRSRCVGESPRSQIASRGRTGSGTPATRRGARPPVGRRAAPIGPGRRAHSEREDDSAGDSVDPRLGRSGRCHEREDRPRAGHDRPPFFSRPHPRVRSNRLRRARAHVVVESADGLPIVARRAANSGLDGRRGSTGT
jgi:hypothetical protein